LPENGENALAKNRLFKLENDLMLAIFAALPSIQNMLSLYF
jgi:hypothetical protein